MKFEPESFSMVELESYDESSCTPVQPSDDWKGVIINIPKRIILSKQEKLVIPICGFFLMSQTTLFHNPELMTASIKDMQTGNTYNVIFGEDDPAPIDLDEGPINPEELSGASGGYFNLNLTDYIYLPSDSAIYEIKVYLAGANSNAQFVEVIVQS